MALAISYVIPVSAGVVGLSEGGGISSGAGFGGGVLSGLATLCSRSTSANTSLALGCKERQTATNAQPHELHQYNSTS